MAFWQELSPTVRWTVALGGLLLLVLLSFRQCSHAPAERVLRHRGIAGAR